MSKITQEDIKIFLEGRNPQERIVNLDYSYKNDYMTVYYRDEHDNKCRQQDPFYPFLWATKNACLKLAGDDRKHLSYLLKTYGIKCIALSTENSDGVVCEKMRNGYTYMFKATVPMSYSRFLNFFKDAGNPVFSDVDKENQLAKDKSQYLCVTPQEQYLIYTGKRFFKGYDDYNQVLRMTFDLETQGLDPTKHRIEWYGISFNRPVTYKGETKEYSVELQVTGNTKEELDRNELKVIETAFKIIYTFRPDIITAHNGENFDWNFIIERCHQLGTSIEAVSSKYFGGQSIGKNRKESVLKLGGEVEHFYRTIVPGIIVTDSLHAVRRAQATDSNFKEANLKYATKYLGLKKPNRVYTPGDKISEISNDYEKHYAFNNKNGDWYKYDPTYVAKDSVGKSKTKKFVMVTKNTLEEGYELVTGHYIIERYLADDLWECDNVEYALNGTDFMLAKIIPVPFQKVVTMGTAGQWKAIMMAWSYENGLAIPNPANEKMATGGLSRLLCVGLVKNVVKLDFNSLYPSIILTWAISDATDLLNATLYMLEYVLTTRETHKKLKKAAGKRVDAFEELINKGEVLTEDQTREYEEAKSEYKVEDNRQAVVKKLGNSYFGSLSSLSGSVFPWKSTVCGERVTCTGRQSLRLMISHFSEISEQNGLNDEDYNYKPIVGDSFMPDTPLFIKYDNGLIDIKPISELIDEDEIKVDELGREYDYSKKDYKVLCLSGWMKPSYIYRHKTDKDIYEVTEGDMKVEVTEDHSLFNSDKVKIKPSEINENTELEYYNGIIGGSQHTLLTEKECIHMGAQLGRGEIDRVPIKVLNVFRKNLKECFYNSFMSNYRDDVEYSKTCLAGLQYLKKMIS